MSKITNEGLTQPSCRWDSRPYCLTTDYV